MKRYLLIAVTAALAGVAVTVLSLTLGSPSRPTSTAAPVVFRVQADGARLRLTRPGRVGTAAAPTVGELLSASTGGWTGNPTSFAYQWEQCDSAGANCTNILGAAGSCAAGSCTITYAIVIGDLGHTIRVVLTASNAAGPGPSATSAQTGVVTNTTGTITFDGSFEQGSHTQPTAIQPWGGTPQSFNWQGTNPGSHFFGDFYYDNGTSSSPTTGSLFTAASTSLVAPLAGSWSGRIVLPTTPAGPTLTNVTLQGLVTPAPGDVGSTNYYGLAFYIPQGEQINSSAFQGMNMWEQHFNAVWGAPVAMQLHTTGPSAVNGTASSVVVALETGACNSSNSANYVAPFTATTAHGCQYRSNAGANQCNLPSQPNIGAVTCLPGFYAIPPGAVQYGVWNELVFAVNEQSTATGSIQSYYKTLDSPTWTQGANITGIPTIQWDIANGCCGYPVKEDAELYGGAQTAPFSMNIDNEEIGTSLAAVQAQMPTSGVTPVAPTNTALPAISGTAQQGSLLTSSTGTWTGTPNPTFTYQWQDCNSGGTACSNISGATVNSYTPVSPDVGHTIRVAVTGTNSAGNAVATSSPTAVVTAGGGGGIVGTGPSLAACTGSCTTPSFTQSYINVSAPGSGCTGNGGGTDQCPIRVFVPGNLVTTNPAAPVPLVIDMPDGTGVTQASGMGDWVNYAATGKFIVVESCPSTTACVPNDDEFRGGGTTGGGETAQIAAVVNYMKTHYQIDANRIFATGGSKGGNAAFDIACDPTLEPLFAGVAPYSAWNHGATNVNPIPWLNGHCRAFLTAGTQGASGVIANPHPIMFQYVASPQDSATLANCWTLPAGGGLPPRCTSTANGDWAFSMDQYLTGVWSPGDRCAATPVITRYDSLTTGTGVSASGQIVSSTYENCATLANGNKAEAQSLQWNKGTGMGTCHWASCTQNVNSFDYNIARATWDFWTTGTTTPS